MTVFSIFGKISFGPKWGILGPKIGGFGRKIRFFACFWKLNHRNFLVFCMTLENNLNENLTECSLFSEKFSLAHFGPKWGIFAYCSDVRFNLVIFEWFLATFRTSTSLGGLNFKLGTHTNWTKANYLSEVL